MFYCKNNECEKKDCPYHSTNLKSLAYKDELYHLEGNPLFCKKKDWNNNQVKEDDK